MARLRWLLVVVVLFVTMIGCWSGRRRGPTGGGGGGGSGSDNDGPWNGGGTSPALTRT